MVDALGKFLRVSSSHDIAVPVRAMQARTLSPVMDSTASPVMDATRGRTSVVSHAPNDARSFTRLLNASVSLARIAAAPDRSVLRKVSDHVVSAARIVSDMV